MKEVNSLLCIGLDPHGKELASAMGKEYPSEYDKLSQEDKCDAAFTFCKTIIDATVPYAACYKPNAAFFEALGSDLGNTTLARVLREIPTEIPILLDVKRGDIGSTASAYAEACYDHLGGRVDAVTLSPLMGWDSVGPFVSGEFTCKWKNDTWKENKDNEEMKTWNDCNCHPKNWFLFSQRYFTF